MSLPLGSLPPGPLPPVTLEGEVVRLEPLSLDHIAGLTAAAAGSRETYGFTWVPHDEADARAYIESALADWRAGRALPFATIHRATGVVLGTTRFGNIERWSWPAGNANLRPIDTVEIGWTWLTAAAQRTPVNTEAKYLQLTHAFEVLTVHRVTIQTDERNSRSRAAIERIGGQFEGILRANRAAADGIVRSTAVYSIIESEWPAVKVALQIRLQR